MTKPASFRDVIDLWPSREAAAEDVGTYSRKVSKWWQRDSIPADWWSAILATNVAQSHRISADLLTKLAARPPEGRA